MPIDKFIFKVYRNGHVERVRDCDNITFRDVSKGLGVALNHIECRPISDSGIYAFYGDENCDVLIFAIPEHKPGHPMNACANDTVHGILASQFNILSTQQRTLI